MAKLIRKSGRKGFALRSCVDLHFRLRLPLEPEQIKDADIAVDFTGQAFAETLAAMKTFKNENELSAHLEWGMKKRSPSGLSFPNIVASGKNATILHYLKNDEPIAPGSLVLLDFGVRYGTMHADITRTVPHNGKYNPLQALLYGIVLDANKETAKNARPGETIRNLNKKTWEFLEAELKTRFLNKGGKAIRSYLGQPHGVSHLMGEQEHDGDPYRIYQDYPLKEGWQISNEPGLYGHFEITLNGRKYLRMDRNPGGRRFADYQGRLPQPMRRSSQGNRANWKRFCHVRGALEARKRPPAHDYFYIYGTYNGSKAPAQPRKRRNMSDEKNKDPKAKPASAAGAPGTPAAGISAQPAKKPAALDGAKAAKPAVPRPAKDPMREEDVFPAEDEDELEEDEDDEKSADPLFGDESGEAEEGVLEAVLANTDTSERIILVVDEDGQRRNETVSIITQILPNAVIEVADDPEEALGMMEEGDFDTFVVNFLMPGYSSSPFVKAVANHPGASAPDRFRRGQDVGCGGSQKGIENHPAQAPVRSGHQHGDGNARGRSRGRIGATYLPRRNPSVAHPENKNPDIGTPLLPNGWGGVFRLRARASVRRPPVPDAGMDYSDQAVLAGFAEKARQLAFVSGAAEGGLGQGLDFPVIRLHDPGLQDLGLGFSLVAAVQRQLGLEQMGFGAAVLDRQQVVQGPFAIAELARGEIQLGLFPKGFLGQGSAGLALKAADGFPGRGEFAQLAVEPRIQQQVAGMPGVAGLAEGDHAPGLGRFGGLDVIFDQAREQIVRPGETAHAFEPYRFGIVPTAVQEQRFAPLQVDHLLALQLVPACGQHARRFGVLLGSHQAQTQDAGILGIGRLRPMGHLREDQAFA